MSKKSKKKQQYSRYEFMDICCEKCMLCSANTSPIFCYDLVYKQNPKRFISHVFKNLMDITSRIANGEEYCSTDLKDEAAKIFDKAFHDVYFSDKEKSRDLFIEQVCANRGKNYYDSYSVENEHTSGICNNLKKNKKQKRKENKKKSKFVVEAYPTFFCNPGFLEEINILLNANNDKQQNDPEECAGEPEAIACEATNSS